MKTTKAYLAAIAVILSIIIPFSNAIANSAEENPAFGLYCPGDAWIDCYDDIWNLSDYGWAYYVDYEGTHYLYNPVINYYLNSCNTGYITRTWSVQDYHGYWHYCTQHIYVGGGGFNESNINWPPQGLVLEGCNPNTHPSALPYPYNNPTYDYISCSLIAKTYSDQLFTISPSCKKVLRKWKIIDWCQYIPNHPGSPGLWEYTQVIKLEESAPPQIACPDDALGWSQNCTDALVEAEPLVLSQYTCGGDFVIKNNSPYAFDDENDISGIYPIGTTTVKYTIYYACGKKMFCYVDVVVEDKKAAVPVCLGDIAAGMMTVYNPDTEELDGMIEIWASDFDKGSYHTCREGPLHFSFSSDVEDVSRVFTCENVGTNELQLWVTDVIGNQSYCHVNLHLQMNNPDVPNCQPVDPLEHARLSGIVTNKFEKSLENVEIKLEGMEMDTSYHVTVDTSIVTTLDSFQSVSGTWLYLTLVDTLITEEIDTIIESMFMEYMTDKAGSYDFEELEMYHDYMVKPTKETSHADGVDAEDLQRVFQHVSGAVPFENPLDFIMADVDKSGAVDIIDVIHMLSLYRGIQETLPVENNWVFISKNIDIDEVEDPFTLQTFDYLYFESLEAELEGNDFWGLQLGNLNGSVVQYPDKGSRKAFTSQDKKTILSTLDDPSFGMMYAQLDTYTLENGTFENAWIEDYNGQQVVIWNAENPEMIDKLLEVNKESLKVSGVHDVLGIVDFEIAPPNQEPSATELLSSYPNPFSDRVILSLFNGANQNVELKIYDPNGKLFYVESKSFSKGLNSWIIDLGQQAPLGLLYYTINTGAHILNGKLVRVK